MGVHRREPTTCPARARAPAQLGPGDTLFPAGSGYLGWRTGSRRTATGRSSSPATRPWRARARRRPRRRRPRASPGRSTRVLEQIGVRRGALAGFGPSSRPASSAWSSPRGSGRKRALPHELVVEVEIERDRDRRRTPPRPSPPCRGARRAPPPGRARGRLPGCLRQAAPRTPPPRAPLAPRRARGELRPEDRQVGLHAQLARLDVGEGDVAHAKLIRDLRRRDPPPTAPPTTSAAALSELHAGRRACLASQFDDAAQFRNLLELRGIRLRRPRPAREMDRRRGRPLRAR